MNMPPTTPPSPERRKNMPTDVQVTSISSFSKRAAAAWNMDGARFHVWFDFNTKKLDSDRLIYKNPPHGVDHQHPDYFKTRYLKADLPKNAETLQQVFAEIDRRDLITAALAAEKEEFRKRDAENVERARLNRITEAALLLYEACEAAEQVLVEGAHVMVHAQLRAALAKARGE